MTELHELRPPSGSRRDRKRVGRGPGSGKGKTSGRGHKGQKARSGVSIPAGFEGGQMPLQRRIPKRGFTPLSRVEYQVVNVRVLEDVRGDEITPELLHEQGLIGSLRAPVKILGDGELTRSVRISAHAFSRAAREKIESAGGTATVVES
jgi:large subunit ribosomal protein L15